MNPDIFAGFHIFPAVFYRIVVTIQNKTGGISMKHIVLTGGGTAGHVTPNIALIALRSLDTKFPISDPTMESKKSLLKK